MSEPGVTDDPRLELAYRAEHGTEVQLLYSTEDESVAVMVHEVSTGVILEIPVEPDQALVAFYQPYAYAARRVSVDERPSGPDRGRFAPRSWE